MATSPIMSGHKSPLRDRLLSNSPDPIKCSIIRESGMGWISPTSNTGSTSSGSSGSITSPLRIAKRESPRLFSQPQLARRSSSSYKHVTRNNLVSKSPFKSQLPALSAAPRYALSFPSSRRVSGEKRPRPPSMHEQAEDENERPFSLKRERRQSKGYQGLIQKEPVTKSPFRQCTPSAEEQPPPPPLSQLVSRISIPPTSSGLSATSPHTQVHNTSPSPGRSSLVSRRMRGPRLSNGGRRERRKTVTFDERCDVVEFDREEETDEEMALPDSEEQCDDSDVEPDLEHNSQAEIDPSFSGADLDLGEQSDRRADSRPSETLHLPDESTERLLMLGMALDPDANISGIVDEMLAFSGATVTGISRKSMSPSSDTYPSASGVTSAPYANDNTDFASESEAEGGIPLGISHAIHCLQPQRSQSPQSHHFSPRSHPPSVLGSPLGTPATPPPTDQSNSPNDSAHLSTAPLGRPTHADRIRQAKQDNQQSECLSMLPSTPSPRKSNKKPVARVECGAEDLIPRFETEAAREDGSTPCPGDVDDPFNLEVHNRHRKCDSIMSANSSTESNVNDSYDKMVEDDSPCAENIVGVDVDRRRHFPSPDPNIDTASSENSDSGVHGRQRISRADVRRRLVDRHGSPVSASLTPSLKPQAILFDEAADVKQDGPDDKDTLSVMTAATDFSTETAIIGLAERKILTIAEEKKSLPLVKSEDIQTISNNQTTTKDFHHGNIDSGGPSFIESMEGINLMGMDCKTNNIYNSSLKMGDVDVDMDMRSALDRLMDDVAGTKADASILTEEGDSYEHRSRSSLNDKLIKREATDSTLLHQSFASRDASTSSAVSIPPPLPPKDNIRSREQLIMEKRREARRTRNELGNSAPATNLGGKGRHSQELLGVGRPSRRRSMSTGDADRLDRRTSKSRSALLDIGVGEVEGLDEHFGYSIEKELQKKLEDVPSKQRKTKYLVREHQGTIYASSSDLDNISHMAGAGDVDAGKAWRAVRRPSDMNEYSKQIREYRSQEKSDKAYGKVFVKVLGVKGIHIPVPSEPTALTCTLNNGIHFVSTPECRLGIDFAIEQEFELIEHNRLEFTLTLKVRRDAHISAQFKAMTSTPPPAPIPPPIVHIASKGGMRGFFSSSPKKSSKDKVAPVQTPPPAPPSTPRLSENLARYLKSDCTLARAFVSFKDIAARCDARLFETSYPLIGQRVELGGKYSTLQVGEIVLQMFRLPPLPGIAPEQLPQSLEECHRGLRHINWHKVTYFEGTLTQSGGDCSTWRRRRLRVIGANLVAFNDVTKKATVAIDLNKAIGVEDDQEVRKCALSPGSGATSRSSRYDEYDGLYGVERSFRLIFSREQEIVFFADTDEEKARWLDVLRALVGHIPPHPLWAELLWQRQEDLAKGAFPTQMISQPPSVEPCPLQSTSRPSAQSTPSWLIPKGPQR